LGGLKVCPLFYFPQEKGQAGIVAASAVYKTATDIPRDMLDLS
jgi:hypothetical protein